MMGRTVAGAQIIMCFIAAGGYLMSGDLRRGLYWFFAGCISVTVTV